MEPDWILLPPGDAALTRRVKTAGPHRVESERRGRRIFTLGVWANPTTIARIQAELKAERATESFTRRKVAEEKRREKVQTQYVEDFTGAVLAYLDFHSIHAETGQRLANAVAAHATPVSSGTVARTKRIPIEERAEAAVIAWLRHQTTGYDHMVIPRIKGRRRELRRMLAQRSKQLLQKYRMGDAIAADCLLKIALARC